MAIKTKERHSDTVIVPPFTIEADNPRNSDLIVQSIENCRLRSKIKPTKQIFDREPGMPKGEQVEVPENARMIGGIPRDIPGMRLSVNPMEGTYEITDPLEGDERTLERIQNAINRSTGYKTGNKLSAVRSREGHIDKDRMKTLVRELYFAVEAGHAKMHKGPKLSLEDINDLPGRYLLNASNFSQWNQPKYEDEFEGFKEKINRLG